MHRVVTSVYELALLRKGSKMVWIEDDLSIPQDHDQVVSEVSWPSSDIEIIKNSKRRPTGHQNWHQLVKRGKGMLFACIVGSESIAARTSLLYLKDERGELCTSIIKGVSTGSFPMIGDQVLIDVEGITEVASVTAINHKIDKVSHCAMAASHEIVLRPTFRNYSGLDSESTTLNQALCSSTGKSKLELVVFKTATVEEESHQSLQIIGKDMVGDLAYLKLNGSRVRVRNIKADMLLIITNGIVAKYGQFYNVFIKSHSMIELYSRPSSKNTTLDSTRLLELPSNTIKSCLLEAESLPIGCEQTFQLNAFVSEVTIDHGKILTTYWYGKFG